MWRAAVLLVFLSLPAQAGPWLRPAGETYLSFSTETTERGGRVETWLSVYAEHGLRPGLTIGIDAGGRDDGRAAKALAFARLPLIERGDWRMAAQIGIGASLDDGRVAPLLRPGLSIGRGLDIMEGGWIAADLFVDADRDGARLGLDAVAGLRPTPRDAVLLGIRGGPDGLRVAPGYERRFGRTWIGGAVILDPAREAPPSLQIRAALDF